MKLIKLTLNNIGPYKGEHIIDFNELNNSLFLITGPTGSGKSYIFDSICYALYSETSGGKRETDDLKSKYATLEDTASVELEFEYQKKLYKIRREPKQFKKMKRKGAGGIESKEYNAVAVLTMPDGSVVEKDVTGKIKEIIGLDYNQFKMTMMIAQGDFYSLINAGTKDREAIFRKILNTEKLNCFTEELKKLMDQKYIEVAKINTSIDTLLSTFSFDDETNSIIKNPNGILSSKLPLIKSKLDLLEDGLNDEKKNLDLLKDNMLNANNNYTKASLNNDNFDSYHKEKDNNDKLLLDKPIYDNKKAKYELAEKASKVLAINKDYERIMNTNKLLRDSLNNLAEDIKNLNKEKDELLPSYNKKLELEELNQSLLIKIKDLESNLKEIDKYKAYKLEKEKILDNIKKLKDNKASVVELCDNISKEIEKLNKIASLESKSVEIETLRLGIEKIDSEIKELKSKGVNIDTYLNEISDYKELSKRYDDKLNEYNIAFDNYNKYEKAFFDSIAGILAKDLKEGVPCPVCGNFHHVKKAILNKELSEDEKKRLKKISDDLFNEVNMLKNDCGMKSTSISRFKEYISSFMHIEFNENNIVDLYNELIKSKENEKKQLIERRDSLIEENRRIDSAKNEVTKLQSELDSNKTLIEDIDLKINDDERSLAGINSLIESMSEYEGMDKESIEKEMDKANDEYNKNVSFISDVDSKSIDLGQKLAAKKNLVEDKNKELNKAEAELKDITAILNDAIKDNGFDSVDMAKSNSLSEYEMKNLGNELNDYDYKLKSSSARLEDYKNKGYDKLVYQDLGELEKVKNNTLELYNEANENYSKNYSTYSNNKKSYIDLSDLNKESFEARSTYNEIEILYNVASGKVSGNKVNFEVYYQLQIFDEILKVASFKFNKMTDGRYEMLRGVPKGGNGQIGLEIDVRDLYNGEIRPVSGLSGGESFQASMSLALAFSDIIQIKAGGVELNSMFIDEGFGTLDNEMLDNTKKTLLEIGESTNRRIGIISHIAELEKSIPSKIVVKKTSNGSSFTVVNE